MNISEVENSLNKIVSKLLEGSRIIRFQKLSLSPVLKGIAFSIEIHFNTNSLMQPVSCPQFKFFLLKEELEDALTSLTPYEAFSLLIEEELRDRGCIGVDLEAGILIDFLSR